MKRFSDQNNVKNEVKQQYEITRYDVKSIKNVKFKF